ncbi:MAG: helix-turn-helix domain-containing protein [Clostridia bacterium]|nr:helix-turn-helix domain-containing protein [Clostridia bacterium]
MDHDDEIKKAKEVRKLKRLINDKNNTRTYQQRARVLLCIISGKTIIEVIRETKASEFTVRTVKRLYQEGGIDKVCPPKRVKRTRQVQDSVQSVCLGLNEGNDVVVSLFINDNILGTIIRKGSDSKKNIEDNGLMPVHGRIMHKALTELHKEKISVLDMLEISALNNCKAIEKPELYYYLDKFRSKHAQPGETYQAVFYQRSSLAMMEMKAAEIVLNQEKWTVVQCEKEVQWYNQLAETLEQMKGANDAENIPAKLVSSIRRYSNERKDGSYAFEWTANCQQEEKA